MGLMGANGNKANKRREIEREPTSYFRKMNKREKRGGK